MPAGTASAGARIDRGRGAAGVEVLVCAVMANPSQVSCQLAHGDGIRLARNRRQQRPDVGIEAQDAPVTSSRQVIMTRAASFVPAPLTFDRSRCSVGADP